MPLDRGSYGVRFTDAQWATLQKVFATGVCDYSKPGNGQQNTVAWQTYQTPAGKVIYGGRALGAPLRSLLMSESHLPEFRASDAELQQLIADEKLDKHLGPGT